VVAAGQGLLDSPCHAYVLGFGTHRFDHLADLPHVGSVVAADDRERQVRLLRFLRSELERRRRSGQVAPRLLLVIDDYAGLRAAFDGYKDIQLLEMVARLIADGAALGINVVACGRQAMSIPLRVAGSVATRLAFAFADAVDFTILGLRLRNIPALPHGRAVDATTGLIVQAVTGWAQITLPEVEPRPLPIEVMPEVVERGEMGAASITDGGWRIPVGIGEHELAPVDLVLDLSDHALVGGGPRTGKSTLLATLADAAASLPGVTVTAFAPRRGPLRDSAAHRIVTDPADLPPLVDQMVSSDEPHLVLVDDADTADDPGGCLARLVAARHEHVHVVAAGRSDELRRAYNHWTGAVRKSKVGVLLDPEPTDAELLGVKLPTPAPGVRPPGRGYLVSSGSAQLVQIAR
jgi:DNA segregation ATPase FtsK/SpoIIIE, S-DNA-T family